VILLYDDNVSLRKIEFSINIHATENLDKISQIIQDFLPSDKFNKDTLKITKVLGGYGNPIKILRYHTQDPDINQFIYNVLINRLFPGDKKQLYIDFEKKINNKNELYLRIDKKSLFNEKIKISNNSDVLRFILSFSCKNIKGNKRKLTKTEIFDFLQKSHLVEK